jgi:hypothetical protein
MLGAEWLSRWQRSDAKSPLGVAVTDESWLRTIIQHPQFRSDAA